MKCIKEKCRYYKEHDFMTSVYVCNLSRCNISKDKEKDCLIDSVIETEDIYLHHLKMYRKEIEKQSL